MKLKIDNTTAQEFKAFVTTYKSELESAKIPESYFENLFEVHQLVDFSELLDEVTPFAEILIQLLTGNVDYYKQHYNTIKENGFLIISAAYSGQITALDWAYEQDLVGEPRYQNDPDKKQVTINGIFAAILLKNNLQSWCFEKSLFKANFNTFLIILSHGSLEQFIEFNQSYPQIVFESDFVSDDSLRRVFNLVSQASQLNNPKYSIVGVTFLWEFQLLTGDVAFYEKHKDKIQTHAANVVKCAAGSGELEALAWVLKHGLINPNSGLDNQALSALICSKNTKAYDWALENRVVADAKRINSIALLLNYFEGFVWFITKFPHEFCEIVYDHVEPKFWQNDFSEVVWEEHFQILNSCKQHQPHLLLQRNAEGKTLVHQAAALGHMGLLDWYLEHCPILFKCNDNLKNETILHLGALHGHQNVIDFGMKHFKELALMENKYGANMAVYALNSLNASFFNTVLALTKDPSCLKYTEVMRDSKLESLLNTLNKALESNYRLTEVSFCSINKDNSQTMIEIQPEQFSEIQSKLERNKLINRVLVFLMATLDTSSCLHSFPPEILGLICTKTIMTFEAPKVVLPTEEEILFTDSDEEDAESFEGYWPLLF